MQQMKIVKRLIYASGLILLLACNSDDAPGNSDDSLLTPKLTVTESDYKGYFHLDASGSSAQAPYQITNQSLRVTDDTGQVVFNHEFEGDNDSLRRHFDKGHYNAVLTTSAAAENTDSSDALVSSSNVSFSSDTTSCTFNGSSCLWTCSVNDDSQSQVTCIPNAADANAECHYDNLYSVLQVMDQVCVSDQTFDTSTTVWLRAYGGSGANSESGGTQGLGGFAQTITSLDDLYARFGDYYIYFVTGNKGKNGNGGASTIISGNPPTQTGSDDDLSYSFAMSDIIALAGGGGAVDQDDDADGISNGGHAASMRVGYCATSQGQDADDSNASEGVGGGSYIYDEDITNDSDYCSDDILTIHAIGGSESGSNGIGGMGGGDNGWSNFDELNTYWSGDGDGGQETGCSGGGGFGGGGACDGEADLGGGGGGSFAMAPTTADFDAYDSDSSNYGTGYIAVIFNASPSEYEGYCQLSCSGYGDPDDNGSYSQAICQPVDAGYDTHECNSLNLTYVIDSLNSMDILNATASSNSSIWLRAYGAAGTDGKDTDDVGGGTAGSGGAAQTVISLDSYQTKYGTDDIYFLLGDKSSSNGGSGSSTLVTTIPALYDRHVDLAGTLLVAGAGGGGGQSIGTYVGGSGGDGAVATSYVAGECSVKKGSDAKDNDGGSGGGSNLSSSDIGYCNLNSSSNQAFILAKATAGGGNGNAGSSGIGGLGATPNGVANVLWMNNERLSENWVGTGNGGQGDSGEIMSRASGAGGGGYGGGGGGFSRNANVAKGGGGGGSYAASALTTDYDACDTSQDNCGLSKNTQDSDHSGVGYIELVINVSPQMSDPNGS